MRIAIVGGRDFNDYDLLKKSIKVLPGDTIISGGARGADTLAKRFAYENRLNLVEHSPDWDKFGKRAGFIRNELIVKDAEVVYAFWDGVSKGTANSISIAKRLCKNLEVIYY